MFLPDSHRIPLQGAFCAWDGGLNPVSILCKSGIKSLSEADMGLRQSQSTQVVLFCIKLSLSVLLKSDFPVEQKRRDGNKRRKEGKLWTLEYTLLICLKTREGCRFLSPITPTEATLGRYSLSWWPEWTGWMITTCLVGPPLRYEETAPPCTQPGPGRVWCGGS